MGTSPACVLTATANSTSTREVASSVRRAEVDPTTAMMVMAASWKAPVAATPVI